RPRRVGAACRPWPRGAWCAWPSPARPRIRRCPGRGARRRTSRSRGTSPGDCAYDVVANAVDAVAGKGCAHLAFEVRGARAKRRPIERSSASEEADVFLDRLFEGERRSRFAALDDEQPAGDEVIDHLACADVMLDR